MYVCCRAALKRRLFQDANHGGLQELEAWQQRAQALATLYAQLQAPAATRVVAVLGAAKSAQHLALSRWVGNQLPLLCLCCLRASCLATCAMMIMPVMCTNNKLQGTCVDKRCLRVTAELAASLEEARAIARYLTPLAPTLRTLSEAADLATVPAAVSKALGGVLLGWKHNLHCRTPSRLVSMLQAVSNDVVNQAMRFLRG